MTLVSSDPRALRTPTALALGIALAFGCALVPAHAQQVLPDAGQTLQELKRTPEPERQSPLPQVEMPDTAPVLPGGQSVTIRSLEFSGNTVIDSAALSAAVSDAIGSSQDLAGLRAVADRVTELYRRSGYLFARAYLPPQDLKDGLLRIAVLEGRYGQVGATVDDSPRATAQAQQFLAPLKPGSVIESKALERATLLLGDLPGVAITPVIKPGAEVGTGDLGVDVQRTPSLDGSVGLDNGGNRYSGTNRLQFNLDWNSPFRLGDQLSLRSLVSDHKLWLGSLAYNAPIGGQGLRFNVSHAHTHYELGDLFASAEASGYAKISSAGLSYPLLRSNAANLKLSVSYQYKQLRDDKAGSSESKSSRSIPLTLDFDQRDGLLGGGVSYGSLSYTAGRLDAPADVASSRLADGSFGKLNLDVLRLQSLTAATSVFGRFSGQWSDKNLDSSERVSLGGSGGVRAYPNGEAVGDQGWLLQLELRHAIGNFEPYAFVDAAHIRVDAERDPAAAPTARNDRNLGGVGFGVRWQSGGWNLDAAVARRTYGGAPEADSNSKPLRGWVSVVRHF